MLRWIFRQTNACSTFNMSNALIRTDDIPVALGQRWSANEEIGTVDMPAKEGSSQAGQTLASLMFLQRFMQTR